MTHRKTSIKVSVLISAYNAAEYIEESLQSVLDQTYSNIEILIMDDGSSDETLYKVQQFSDSRISCFTQENAGKPSAINYLIGVAQGEYLMIHDADDVSKSNRVACLLDGFDANPTVGLILSSYSLILDGQEVAPKPRAKGIQECCQDIASYKMPGHDATMIVQAEFAKKMMFAPEIIVSHGHDFIVKVGELTDIVVLSDVLYEYRIHTDSLTSRRYQEKLNELLIIVNSAKIRRSERTITVEELLAARTQEFGNKGYNLLGHFCESAFLLVQQHRRLEAIKVAILAATRVRETPLYLKPLAYALLPKFVGRLGKNYFGEG